MAYPDIAALRRKTDKDRLVVVHRSFASMFGEIALFIVTLAAVLLININHFEYASRLRWLAIVPVGVLLDLMRRYYNDLYVLGRDHLTHYEGRISLSYNVPSIRYTDLRAVNVVQSVMGRIFNFGDVQLGTAGQNDYELVLMGVYSPKELAKLIDGLRNDSTKSSMPGVAPAQAVAALSAD